MVIVRLVMRRGTVSVARCHLNNHIYNRHSVLLFVRMATLNINKSVISVPLVVIIVMTAILALLVGKIRNSWMDIVLTLRSVHLSHKMAKLKILVPDLYQKIAMSMVVLIVEKIITTVCTVKMEKSI